MNRDIVPVPSYPNNNRKVGNVIFNPTYISTISIDVKVENTLANERLHVQELGHVNYRGIIRNSIQLPETRRRRKKSCCWKLFEDTKQGRLYIAYVLLITSFMLTFASVGLCIAIRTFPLSFFPDCWKVTVGLALLTMLIGVYVCWEEDICRQPRRTDNYQRRSPEMMLNNLTQV